MSKSVDRKAPNMERTPNQTANRRKINTCFGNSPENNIAIATGKILGITVVDLDSMDAVNFATEHNFPIRTCAQTEKGCHFYYQYRKEIRNSQLIL